MIVILGLFLFVFAVSWVFSEKEKHELEKNNKELKDVAHRQLEVLKEQRVLIWEMNQELAKKDSLTSILRNEIEEKENV